MRELHICIQFVCLFVYCKLIWKQVVAPWLYEEIEQGVCMGCPHVPSSDVCCLSCLVLQYNDTSGKGYSNKGHGGEGEGGRDLWNKRHTRWSQMSIFFQRDDNLPHSTVLLHGFTQWLSHA